MAHGWNLLCNLLFSDASSLVTHVGYIQYYGSIIWSSRRHAAICTERRVCSISKRRFSHRGVIIPKVTRLYCRIGHSEGQRRARRGRRRGPPGGRLTVGKPRRDKVASMSGECHNCFFDSNKSKKLQAQSLVANCLPGDVEKHRQGIQVIWKSTHPRANNQCHNVSRGCRGSNAKSLLRRLPKS